MATCHEIKWALSMWEEAYKSMPLKLGCTSLHTSFFRIACCAIHLNIALVHEL